MRLNDSLIVGTSAKVVSQFEYNRDNSNASNCDNARVHIFIAFKAQVFFFFDLVLETNRENILKKLLLSNNANEMVYGSCTLSAEFSKLYNF